ncbi:MAG TPA: thioredoxin domain-containing protein [Membranihabitans sp.]|nr:thioredoxin domain-containing protein [Membranihabitans sp.]
MEQLSGQNFYSEVIQQSYLCPILVQFWAPWCGPCHGLTTTLQQVEASNKYPIQFYGLDVDQFTDLAIQNKVMGVPHTMVFASGYPLDEFSDPLPMHEIELFIKNALLIPSILRHSHFTDVINYEYLLELEEKGISSKRKEVYLLTLARHYIFTDPHKSQTFLNQISEASDQFEDRLFIESMFGLLNIEFSSDRVQKKLWAAKNAFRKRNFESTYQFLLQANLGDSDQNDFVKSLLLGFRQFLGKDHELNRKYDSQFSSSIES